MVSCLPLITASTTGAAELLTSASGVVLPNSEDIQALAEAINHLKSDSEMRKRMGYVARNVTEHYSWASLRQSNVDLLEKLASHEHQQLRSKLAHESLVY